MTVDEKLLEAVMSYKNALELKVQQLVSINRLQASTIELQKEKLNSAKKCQNLLCKCDDCEDEREG